MQTVLPLTCEEIFLGINSNLSLLLLLGNAATHDNTIAATHDNTIAATHDNTIAATHDNTIAAHNEAISTNTNRTEPDRKFCKYSRISP